MLSQHSVTLHTLLILLGVKNCHYVGNVQSDTTCNVYIAKRFLHSLRQAM